MTTDDARVWDPGLQPERTSLAWRRLAMAMLGLALAAPRLVWPIFGGWAGVPTVVVAAGAVALLIGTHRRYLATHDSLKTNHQELLPDGGLVLLTALTALALAAFGLTIVLT